MKTKQIKDIQQKEKSDKWNLRFMNLALHISEWSNCKRLRVASVLVTSEGRIQATGVNGVLSGLPNECEDENGMTKFSSYHSEENVLLECLRQGKSTIGCSLYITHFCCPQCSKLIAASGITHVYYKNDYRDMNGMEILKLAKIKVKKI